MPDSTIVPNDLTTISVGLATIEDLMSGMDTSSTVSVESVDESKN